MRHRRHTSAHARALAIAAAVALPLAGVSTVASLTAAAAAGVTTVVTGPQLSGQSLRATEGKSKDFTVADVAGLPEDMVLQNIVVNWGDGTATSAGLLDPSGNHVHALHVYNEAGKYTTTVTADALPVLRNEVSASTALSTTGTATVGEAVVNLSGEKRTVVPGGAFSGAVADGTDHNDSVSFSDFTAVVDWGDGSVAAACSACVVPSGSDFVVNGTHQYTRAGVYEVRTMVADGGLDVRENPVRTRVVVPVVASVVAGSEGSAFSGNLGSVLVKHQVDVAAVDLPSVSSVTVDWGDGSDTTAGSIAADGTVSGSHTYADEGTYTLTITATRAAVVPLVDAAVKVPWVASSKVTVADAAIIGSTGAGPFSTLVGTPVSGLLGHVVDTDPTAKASDLSATVDWGDGTASAVTLAAHSGGGYDVSGAHTYSTPGVKSGVVHFVDVGGSTADVPFSVTVTAQQVQGITTTGGPTSGVQGIVSVPNTGADLPIATALLLVASGGGLFAVGRRRC